jgi:hypothetical protein
MLTYGILQLSVILRISTDRGGWFGLKGHPGYGQSGRSEVTSDARHRTAVWLADSA